MPKQSDKEEKSIYRQVRDELDLSREKASEMLAGITADQLEKMENGRTRVEPGDVVLMAEAYNHPELCNYYCKNECPIGQHQNLAIEVSELPNIILETVACLNDIQPNINRLIEISRDGKISDNEISDFAFIENKLDQISLAADALHLWVRKTARENNLNAELYRAEMEKVKNA